MAPAPCVDNVEVDASRSLPSSACLNEITEEAADSGGRSVACACAGLVARSGKMNASESVS